MCNVCLWLWVTLCCVCVYLGPYASATKVLHGYWGGDLGGGPEGEGGSGGALHGATDYKVSTLRKCGATGVPMGHGGQQAAGTTPSASGSSSHSSNGHALWQRPLSPW